MGPKALCITRRIIKFLCVELIVLPRNWAFVQLYYACESNGRFSSSLIEKLIE